MKRRIYQAIMFFVKNYWDILTDSSVDIIHFAFKRGNNFEQFKFRNFFRLFKELFTTS